MAPDDATPAEEPPVQPAAGLTCAACGQPNRAEARFCRACGQRLVEATPLAPEPEPVADEATPRPPLEPDAPLDLALPARASRSRSGAVIWVGAALGVFAAFAIAAFLLHQGGWLNHLFAPQPPPAAPLAKPAPHVPPSPIDTMINWQPAHDGDPKTYSIDGLLLTLSSRPQPGGAVPVLHVVAPDGHAGDIAGDANPQGVAASIGVGHIDPAVEGPQVIFATSTGGAHCCDHIRLLELGTNGWTGLDLGQFQGETLASFPRDVDGDGVLDFVMADDRFAGAFSDPASGAEPPRVFDIQNGQTLDMSAQPRYAKLFRKDMKAQDAACLKHGNGACAAFVADAARLGLYGWAWRIMLANYDQATNWTWPTQCLVAGANPCPAGQARTYANMPDALAAFLLQNGYVSGPQQPDLAAATPPSFDCTGADTAVLELICNTPSLSQADHDMSVAYADAASRSSDTDALSDEQRAWFAKRDASAADVAALSALYAERIAELETQGPK
ncbi:MAG TPA: lysozyme inhibitor LprI family protein [Caulobacteraceae bacterium]|jgi:uncharacterized protein YecT (DUF1311 family)